MKRKHIWESPGEAFSCLLSKLIPNITMPTIFRRQKRSLQRVAQQSPTNEGPEKRQKTSEQGPTISDMLHDDPKKSPLLQMLEALRNADCNAQLQSPLFNTIPPEIRNYIFALVLVEEDSKDAISEESYFYRPDYPCYRFIDTALLCTCRRVWLETYAIPRRNVLERHWLGASDRRAHRRLMYAPSPSERELYGDVGNPTDKFWPSECVQVFAQMFALESWQLSRLCHRMDTRRVFPVRRLKLTIRYTDWWHWESNAPLRMENRWSTVDMIPRSVEEVVLELETRYGKKEEMEAIIKNQVMKWKWKGVDNSEYILNEERTKRWTWIGSTKPGGGEYAHHSPAANSTDDLGPMRMTYYVVKMVWMKPKTALVSAVVKE